jgi:hypothetical protein
MNRPTEFIANHNTMKKGIDLMKQNTSNGVQHYVYNSIDTTKVVVADHPISVRDADRAAQELRKTHMATLA